MTTEQILEMHEIAALRYNPIPGEPRRSGGYWIAVAYCRCGHTSPPEHRAKHLAAELEKARNA